MASNYDVLKARLFVGGKPMPVDDQLDALAHGYLGIAEPARERITVCDDNGAPLYDGEVSAAYTRDGKVGVKVLAMYGQASVAPKAHYVPVNKRTLDAILRGDVVVRGGELQKVVTINFANPSPHDPELAKRALELDFDAAPEPEMSALGLYRVTYEDHEGNTQHADVNATDEKHAIQVLTALKMHVVRAYMAQRIDEPIPLPQNKLAPWFTEDWRKRQRK